MSHEDRARRLAADINARLDPAIDPTVTPEIDALYRSMPRETLVLLREAFTIDRDSMETAAGRAFCQSRLDLIARVLAAPRHRPSSHRPSNALQRVGGRDRR